MQLDDVILATLIHNDEYVRKTIPFLRVEYFQKREHKLIFELASQYIDKYNKPPSTKAMIIDLGNQHGIPQELYDATVKLIEGYQPADRDMEWLIDNTEKFCQQRAITNAIHESIMILDSKKEGVSLGAIPALLQEALGVSFDSSVGHDFFEDTDARFEFYHRIEDKLPFNLDYFDRITKGGIIKKSLTVILAGTGVGKSMFMCHCAANNLLDGKNVLYITLEMAEERIAERIDANLLNVTMDELAILPKEAYVKKMDRVKSKTTGRLVIKEYPTSTANASHFRHLLNELKTKKNFVPDVVYIDYINICSSARYKNAGNVNSYTYIKAIAEELRGLAMETNLPFITATQTTRGGYDNSDVSLTDTSESFGLPATADLMFALIATEELTNLGQIMVKQLKNRYSDPNKNKRFVIGVDRAKMKFYDCEQSAQDDIIDDTPVMDNTEFGRRAGTKKYDFDNFK